MNKLLSSFIKKTKEKGLVTSFKATIKYMESRISYIIRTRFLNSYSQFGEDELIDKLLNYKRSGFYIDIGANDAVVINNTYRFYKKGWRGINIEPNVEEYSKLSNMRKGDINLNIGVGNKEKDMNFYLFNPNELSTFSEIECEKYRKMNYELIETRKITIEPLKKIIEKNCNGKIIDFITIDTEGYDLEVLQSNDWEKYRPKVICIEMIEHGTGIRQDDIELFLKHNNYSLIKFNGLNGIFIDSKIKRVEDGKKA